MFNRLSNIVLALIAFVIVISTLVHGSSTEISLFHGLVLHPAFMIAGLLLIAFVAERCNSDPY